MATRKRILFLLMIMLVLCIPALALAQTGSTPSVTICDATVKSAVTIRNVNIRSGPGTRFSKVGRLKKGTEIEILSMRGEWAKILYDGADAYVHSRYLEVKSSSTTISDTALNMYDFVASIVPNFTEADCFMYRVSGSSEKQSATKETIALAKAYLEEVRVSGYEQAGSVSGWSEMISVKHNEKTICSFQILNGNGARLSVPGATYSIKCDEDVFAKLVEVLHFR